MAQKTSPENLEIKNFEYELPDDRIARFPLEKRDDSKLLLFQNHTIAEDRFTNLADHLPPGSLLVFNQAKVVHARLHFQKSTGGKIEIFCLEPDTRYPDISTAMVQKKEVYWKCLLKGAQKWKDDTPLSLEMTYTEEGKEKLLKAQAQRVAREGHSFLIHFSWENTTGEDLSFSEFLEIAGEMPIPPYLKREAEESDEQRYQTIFAKQEGSVAAPTAALHFTPKILQDLKEKGIEKHQLTLHVGAGTFMPVKSETMKGHEMHAEWIELSRSLLLKILAQLKEEKPIVTVGTTSARTMESAYWIGVKLIRKEWQQDGAIAVSQWYPYHLEETYSPTEAVKALLEYMDKNGLEKLITRTKLIIAPGYKFQLLDGLITNFHQPASTLLLMISALVGTHWKKIYQYALDHGFRFLSYGDGSLLWK